jgi:PIN domain nuclease of toxin-antitoxin system
MRVLLDTHALIWWWENSPRLTRRASAILADKDNTLFLSAASGFEIAIKVRLGKIVGDEIISTLRDEIVQDTFKELPVTLGQAIRAGLLPLRHRDPFDRLLIAQAQESNIPILSADEALDKYEVRRIW